MRPSNGGGFPLESEEQTHHPYSQPTPSSFDSVSPITLSVALGYPKGTLPIEFEVKVIEVGNSLRVAIPKEILRAVGIEKGDTLLMTTTDHEIVIRKPEATRRRKA